MSLSHHRPENNDWIPQAKQQVGDAAFVAYGNRVYDLLLRIKAGTYFDINKQVQEENKSVFIKFCCLFLSENGNPFRNYEFSNDYTRMMHKKVEEIVPRKLIKFKQPSDNE